MYSQLSIDCKSSGGESGEPNLLPLLGKDDTVKSGQNSKSQIAKISDCASGKLSSG